jgi:hypothetical protein
MGSPGPTESDAEASPGRPLWPPSRFASVPGRGIPKESSAEPRSASQFTSTTSSGSTGRLWESVTEFPIHTTLPREPFAASATASSSRTSGRKK